MKIRTLIGLLIMIAGVLIIVYGAFRLVQDAPSAGIKQTVGYDSVLALTGAVLFIMGVVIQGVKNIIALIVHLLALIPYYLAITEVQSLGQAGTPDFQTYLTNTELYWAAAIVLGIIGIIVNRIGRKPKQTPSPPAQPTQPPTPKK